MDSSGKNIILLLQRLINICFKTNDELCQHGKNYQLLINALNMC